MVGNIISDIKLDAYIQTHIFLHVCDQNYTCYFVAYVFHSAVCWMYLFMTVNISKCFSVTADAKTHLCFRSPYLLRINS